MNFVYLITFGNSRANFGVVLQADTCKNLQDGLKTFVLSGFNKNNLGCQGDRGGRIIWQ
ncbi:hypothetical protein [Nostoc sp.]|uniref:hypothetical protein n=1 Tax=Nostoc sp. TaxID=1180 RepID=UPI002FF48D4C